MSLVNISSFGILLSQICHCSLISVWLSFDRCVIKFGGMLKRAGEEFQFRVFFASSPQSNVAHNPTWKWQRNVFLTLLLMFLSALHEIAIARLGRGCAPQVKWVSSEWSLNDIWVCFEWSLNMFWVISEYFCGRVIVELSLIISKWNLSDLWMISEWSPSVR